MTQQRYVSRVVYVLRFYLFLLFLFTAYRFLFLAVYTSSFDGLLQLLWTGLRFDARWAGLLQLPVLFFYLFESIFKIKVQPAARWYARLLLLLLLLLFIADFYYYQYAGFRVSPVVLELITPVSVAVKMLWQSYPVLLLLFLMIAFLWLMDKLLLKRIFRAAAESATSSKTILFLVLILILNGAAIWGSFKKYPLTWSDAYAHPATGVFALNPPESFFYGWFYKEETQAPPTNDEQRLFAATLQYDSVRAQQLQTVKQQFTTAEQPLNVVILLAESLATYKTSLAKNQPLHPTPFLKQLGDSSLYFSNCFTPHFGTARAVWNLFTGLPDVNWSKLVTHQPPSSRIPVLLNEMSFGASYYLLGGDGTWADVKGFLKSNVKNIEVLDAAQMKAKAASVWGADDYDLLQQADEIFRKSKTPFFAVIQTASNHEPFTIPSTAAQNGFITVNPEVDSLKRFGFQSAKEFNSMRYLDFCLQKYFERASTASYFSNTVFIVVGDHGTIGKAAHSMQEDWDTYKLKLLHVPLLFYKPGLQQTYTYTALCSLQDIVPTVYGLNRTKPVNGITGIDLLSGYYKTGQFFMLHELHQAGWIAPQLKFLASYENGSLKHVLTNQKSKTDSISALVLAAYKIYADKKQ
ncbi:MAG: LTA synthase family protein [Lacibacter sp.]|jgi:phosphoglycerol transferase MdoB-like AlkP superfamily enzyme